MPLYWGGLCEAVIMNPTSAPNFFTAYAHTGVGTTPASKTSTPQDIKPEINADSITSPETRVSLTTAFYTEYVATAEATLHLK